MRADRAAGRRAGTANAVLTPNGGRDEERVGVDDTDGTGSGAHFVEAPDLVMRRFVDQGSELQEERPFRTDEQAFPGGKIVIGAPSCGLPLARENLRFAGPALHIEALLHDLPDRAALLLVGDLDQLPSVGPGQMLADVIASTGVPVVRLSEVFRQAAESQIIVMRHRIDQGLMPELAPADRAGADPKALSGLSPRVFGARRRREQAGDGD
jgi:hypothetical protein